MKKIISFLLIICSLFSLHISVFAENETVKVLVNTSIRFTVNGEEFIPKEDDDTRVYPLTYNDRTYIPARFIAERTGIDVTWDEATQTVGFITNGDVDNREVTPKNEPRPEPFYDDVILNTAIRFEFNGEEFIPKELDGSRVYPLTYNDRTYIPARFIMERAGIEVTWDEATQTVGFNTASKPDESGKVDNPLSSTEQVGNGTFKSLQDVDKYIQEQRIMTLGDTSNGSMTPTERMAFREKALRGMILFGFEYVAYSDYNYVLETFPSYAEVYSYYMKNAKGMSDAKILEHLTTVYSSPLDAIELYPVSEVIPTEIPRLSIGLPLYETEQDTNQNDLYILRHMNFRKVSETRSVVIKNVSSGMLLLEPNDVGSYFAFKSNKLDNSYMEMLGYYIDSKVSGHTVEGGVVLPNSRVTVAIINGSFLVTMQ